MPLFLPAGLPDPGANGVVSRTGLNADTARTITGTAAEITVTNGDGVSGNPTLSLPSSLTFTGKTMTGGTSIPDVFSQASSQNVTGVQANGAGFAIAARTFTETDTSGSVAGLAGIYRIGIPTLAASSATSRASGFATLYIDGAVVAGTNETITNPRALIVAAGTTFLGGATTVNAGGLTVTAGGLTVSAGTATLNGGMTSAGGSASLNSSSGANTTGLGTGSTTGQVSIGGGSNQVVFGSAITLKSYTIATLPTAGVGRVIYISDTGGGVAPAMSDGTNWFRLSPGYAAIATDAAFTLTHLASATHTRHTGTLTADRALTLSTTNAIAGAELWLTRTGGGAFNITHATKNLATNQWAKWVYDGAAWFLAAFGSL